MASAKICTVGEYLGDSCHQLKFCRKVGLKKLDSFDVDAREVIMWRTGVSILNVDADICFHHEKVVTQRFLLYQKNCCNPFKAHQNEIKGE